MIPSTVFIKNILVFLSELLIQWVRNINECIPYSEVIDSTKSSL